MKTLVATITCWRDEDNGRNDGIRDTWLRWGYLIDHVFFLGYEERHVPQGAIMFSGGSSRISDDYDAIPFKVHRICQYAAFYGYDDLFISDVDTYVAVPLLLNSRVGDYAGWRCDEGHAAGGNGYWLSRKAMLALSNSAPYPGYQDIWVGEALKEAGIPLVHDPRFIGGVPEKYVPGTISAHLGRATGTFDPQWMRDYHKTCLEVLPCG
jgi:hypothetical protein